MTCCVAVLIGGMMGSADSFRAEVAMEVLDAALVKAWAQPDPRDLVAAVLRTAAEVDPKRARDRVRVAAARLQKLALPPTRRDVWHWLAVDVAPHDRKLRDEILRLAIADGREALAAGAIWKAPAEKPKGIPFQDPQRQLEQEKQILAFEVRAWEAVVKGSEDREAASGLLSSLLADARAKGYFGSDAISAYDYHLCRKLSDLDPELLLAVLPRTWEKKAIAEFCGNRAYSRWLDRRKDSFTGILAKYGVENGAKQSDAFVIFAHFDLDRAWAIAQMLPEERNKLSSPRGEIVGKLIIELAWHDPEAALAAAEKETDALTRRERIDQVSRIWAYKRPEQIERAIRNQDNELRRKWARDAAADELAWRKKGNPPRDSRERVPPRMRPMTAAERKAAGLPRGDPDAIRVLENPGDTAWLKGPNRSLHICEAARISYFETGRFADVLRIARNLEATEADGIFCQLAEAISRSGPPSDAVRFLAQVQAPYRAVMTACDVARGLVRGREDYR